MSLRIYTNLQSQMVQKNLTKSTNALNTAIERMTTGFKINHASDNAANYSITTDMSSKISSYKVAEENTAMGIDMVQTMSDNLDLISDLTTRLRALAEQAQNGTYGQASLDAINQEAEAIVSEINRIKSNAVYNDLNLFNSAETARVRGMKMYTTSVGSEGYVILNENGGVIATTGSASSVNDLRDWVRNTNLLLQPSSPGSASSATMEDVLHPQSGSASGAITLSEAFASGTVTGSTTYLISSIEDFYLIDDVSSSLLNIKYVQTADLDFTGQTSAVAPTNNYNQYDGNGYTISNVSNILTFVDGVSTSNALFCGSTDNLILRNIAIKNADDVSIIHVGLLENSYIFGEDVACSSSTGAIVNSYAGNSPEYTDWYTLTTGGETETEFNLQVGIGGDDSSRISFKSVSLGSLDSLISSGLQSSDSLAKIDEYLSKINEQQTQLGAIENRLESVMESINVNYENLVSSRSTLRDADIAETSSQYIKSQILQQASATLLATANQSPAMVLSLLQGL